VVTRKEEAESIKIGNGEIVLGANLRERNVFSRASWGRSQRREVGMVVIR